MTSDEASSTTRPRYMTATRSPMLRTTFEIVADEDHGDAVLLLKVAQQVDDLRLDRDVERRNRLVADQKLRARRQVRARSRRADAGRRTVRADSARPARASARPRVINSATTLRAMFLRSADRWISRGSAGFGSAIVSAPVQRCAADPG